ncbi:MAG: orotidine-5'-phosphate decarboxylase [Paludibacter sp.]|nr:orotidine-5'-phosphate decarboxylase [Paludibacter sp.]
MTKQELFENIQRKKSFLCVGLDTDVNKIPEFLFDQSEDPVFEFNKAIIDATAEYCVAYKPNLAFYESLGLPGWDVLERTVDYIRENYPDQFIIADAKRGDIGNTSAMYARTFFGNMNFDAVTVVPYMGEDSVTPFLTYEDKWVILLALTSNKGAYDFQFMKDAETGDRLFEKVLKASLNWGTDENMLYVVGATKAEMLTEIRNIVPEHFLLVPGVGAQGGSLNEVAKYGLNKSCGLLVNSSRQIIYASSENDFAEKAREEALKVQAEMSEILEKAGLIGF